MAALGFLHPSLIVPLSTLVVEVENRMVVQRAQVARVAVALVLTTTLLLLLAQQIQAAVAEAAVSHLATAAQAATAVPVL